MSRARLAVLSLVLAAVAHGALTGRWIGSGVAIAAFALSLAIPARASLDGFSQRILTLVTAALGGVVGWLETPAPLPPLALGRIASAFAIASLFGAVFRTWMRAPDGGFFATSLFGLAALVACGEAQSGHVYPFFAIAYLALSLAALRAQDDARPRLAALPLRVWIASAVQMGIVLAVTASLAVALPPAATWSRDRILLSLGDATTGLGDRMVLGALEGMLQSNEIVARVYGPHTDYLRGVVYNQYQAGQWAVSTTEGFRTVRTDPAGKAAVRVVLAGASRTSRYLVPLGASAVSFAEGSVAADRFGALRPERGLPTEARFDLSGAPPDFPPAEPTSDDLRVPVKLTRTLVALVRAWTQGADTPEKKIAAIEAHLRTDFRYSLEYKRNPGDPLLDFLGENRFGHCEYFASAMAMLARAAGVPARVVAGYRVAEHNDLGDYDVVREKNAHAWTEVYFMGAGWQVVDATPEDLLPQNEAHDTARLAALWDVAGTLWTRAVERVSELTLPQIIVGLLVFILAGLAVRRWSRPARAAAVADAFWRSEAPPPAVARLLGALALAGRKRLDSEPIERFAARLSTDDEPEAAALLSRYSALRYGGVGDGESLFREMEACAARLRSAV